MGKRTCNKKLALAALLNSPTVREAAKASGISESTLWNFLKDPVFSTEYEEEKGKIVSVAAKRLRSRLDSASDTIHSIMTDTGAPPQVRITAARTVFEYAAKYTELAEIQSRIEALEAARDEEKCDEY